MWFCILDGVKRTEIVSGGESIRWKLSEVWDKRHQMPKARDLFSIVEVARKPLSFYKNKRVISKKS